jgi:hypothetical protein
MDANDNALDRQLENIRQGMLPDGQTGDPETLLLALIDLHEQAAGDDQRRALRTEFLEQLKDAPEEVSHERISDFLAEVIQPTDFDTMSWDHPENVLSFSETLYDFQFESVERELQVREHIRHMLHHALHQFERTGDFEKMIRLLLLSPITPGVEDAEIHRLRNRVYIYELRRIQRRRRFLYGYLIMQTVLVLLVFPLLFVAAENGLLFSQIERLTSLNLNQEAIQSLTFLDGVYWSIITAASIGYGDITPVTNFGKILASLLGLIGVITVGIIAGLIMEWITPRHP